MTGQVISIHADTAMVELDWNETCFACANKTGCFIGTKPEKNRMEVLARISVEPGDRVEIEFRGMSRIFHALLIFGLPVAMLITGGILGSSFFPWMKGEASAVTGAIAGLFLSILILIAAEKIQAGNKKKRMPQIVRLAENIPVMPTECSSNRNSF